MQYRFFLPLAEDCCFLLFFVDELLVTFQLLKPKPRLCFGSAFLLLSVPLLLVNQFEQTMTDTRMLTWGKPGIVSLSLLLTDADCYVEST